MQIAYAVSSKQQILKMISYHPYIRLAITRLLPGPFTILLQDINDVKIGIRFPQHKKCIEFLKYINQPLIMTSANLHQQKPSISYNEAMNIFPSLKGLDGGNCLYSCPSTIIDLTNIRK